MPVILPGAPLESIVKTPETLTLTSPPAPDLKGLMFPTVLVVICPPLMIVRLPALTETFPATATLSPEAAEMSDIPNAPPSIDS